MQKDSQNCDLFVWPAQIHWLQYRFLLHGLFVLIRHLIHRNMKAALLRKKKTTTITKPKTHYRWPEALAFKLALFENRNTLPSHKRKGINKFGVLLVHNIKKQDVQLCVTVIGPVTLPRSHANRGRKTLINLSKVGQRNSHSHKDCSRRSQQDQPWNAEQTPQLQFSRRGPPVSAAFASAGARKVPFETMLHVKIQPLVGTSLTWIWKSDHNVQLINPHKIKDTSICILQPLQSLCKKNKQPPHHVPVKKRWAKLILSCCPSMH